MNPASWRILCELTIACAKKKLMSQQVVQLSWKGIKNDGLSKGMPRKALSRASPLATEI